MLCVRFRERHNQRLDFVVEVQFVVRASSFPVSQSGGVSQCCYTSENNFHKCIVTAH